MPTPRPSTRRRSFPVTVTQLPMVRCAECGRTMAHRAGEASAVLTAHYQQSHAEAVRS
ncbi:MAG: hypothetical protein JNL54_08455 [Kineosporiaceae bacterium]|nr:hypothetical protein [Kineosporiaceae bacterium]